MRGVQIGIGSSEQILAMVPTLYVTWYLADRFADKQQLNK